LTNNTTSIHGNYYTREDLARELNRSTRTLDRWHVQRIGPPRTKLRRSKLIFYKKSAVSDWMEAQTEDTASVEAR